MYCPKCGWQNADDAAKCANCFTNLRAPQQPQQVAQPTQQMPGQPQQPYSQQHYPQQGYQQPYGQQPYNYNPVYVPDNLIWSILVTLFCCVPLGIVAIVKAAEANSKRNIGDYYGAMAAYNASKTWMYWALGIGLAANFVGFMVGVLGALSDV